MMQNDISGQQKRREFIWEMGGGFAGLALGSLLEGDGFFEKHLNGAEGGNALAVRDGHFPTKAKHVIFLCVHQIVRQLI